MTPSLVVRQAARPIAGNKAFSSTWRTQTQAPSWLTGVCGECRRSILTTCQQRQYFSRRPQEQHRLMQPPLHRNFRSTTSNNEGKTRKENIAQETHYDFFPDTLPQGPPPHGSFDINLRTLRNEFLKLQSSAHPDRHPGSLKARAEALSSRINEAYKTLQDPLRRAQYILQLNGVDVEDEAGKTEDMETLGLVMEAREEIEEAETERDLRGLKKANEERVKNTVALLARLLEKGEWGHARQEAVRLKFWYNIREGIEAWKQGGGVPNLLH